MLFMRMYMHACTIIKCNQLYICLVNCAVLASKQLDICMHFMYTHFFHLLNAQTTFPGYKLVFTYILIAIVVIPVLFNVNIRTHACMHIHVHSPVVFLQTRGSSSATRPSGHDCTHTPSLSYEAKVQLSNEKWII